MADTGNPPEKVDVPTQHVPEDAFLGVELGTDTSMPFTTPFKPPASGSKYVRTGNGQEVLQEVLNYDLDRDGPSVNDLVRMRRMDGQARALYRLMTLPIRAALSKSEFVAAEGGDTEAEFIEQVFNTPPEGGGMTVTFHKFMAQLLQGLFDGFSAFEKVFWRPDFGPMAGKITLQKLAHRPSESITFISNENGGFAGLRQRGQKNGKVVDIFLDPEYSLYYAAQEEERKFYGVSFFQSAFFHYDKKVRLYYTAHLAAQRTAVGTRLGTYPTATPTNAKAQFARQLANLSVAQWMAMPEDFKVESLKEGGDFDFMSMINHHNSQMSKSVLASFFDKDQGSDSGSPMVSFYRPGDEMFMMMLRTIQDDIANVINHYVIPQLIDYNFNSGLYPKFQWGTFTDEQREMLASTFDKIASNPQNLTPEFVRAVEENQSRELGLDIDYDEIETREAAQQIAQQQQGIDPTTGQPIQPTNPDDQISQFENSVAQLTAQMDEDDVADEAYRELMSLAGELLDATS